MTYTYEDPTHPDRPTGHLESPEWTEEDRCLLLALEEYESTLCPGGCGQPKHLAWHSHMEGFYEATGWVCHACTVQQGHEVSFSVPAVDKDLTRARIDEFPVFELGVTTTEPSPPATET